MQEASYRQPLQGGECQDQHQQEGHMDAQGGLGLHEEGVLVAPESGRQLIQHDVEHSACQAQGTQWIGGHFPSGR
eukprot:8566253-Prorocentrum_lima.AAC.1